MRSPGELLHQRFRRCLLASRHPRLDVSCWLTSGPGGMLKACRYRGILYSTWQWCNDEQENL